MKLFHVSDLHLRTDPAHNAVSMGAMRALHEKMVDGDVVVVTGDITDDGKAEQYARAREVLLPFKGRIVVVPGNHDFGPLGNFYDAESVRRFAKLRSDLGCDRPHLFRRGGVPFGEIIVLDSNLRTKSPVDFAEGRVGWWQRFRLVSKLDAMCKAGAVSVVAMHHSPLCGDWFLRLQDSKEFMEAVLGRADIVLVGHEHKYREMHYPMNLPVEHAKTTLYSAGSLQYEGTKVISVEVEER